MKYGIIQTCYKQVELAEENIKRVRNKYKNLHNMPIILISTAKEDVGFGELAEFYSNVHFIHFQDAPGPDNFTSKSNPDLKIEERHPQSRAPIFEGFIPGGEWRYKYIAARVLLSIEKGLHKAKELGLDAVLHLHSDTYWKSENEYLLLDDFRHVINKSLLFYGDLSIYLENNNMLPNGYMFCPEGIIFNINECYKYGYGFEFHEIYDNPNSNGKFVDLDQFCCVEYSSTEPLLSQFAYWKLTGTNIYNYDDKVADIYREKVQSRIVRPHHGNFFYGLVNVETRQNQESK